MINIKHWCIDHPTLDAVKIGMRFYFDGYYTEVSVEYQKTYEKNWNTFFSFDVEGSIMKSCTSFFEASRGYDECQNFIRKISKRAEESPVFFNVQEDGR